ncbi:helix-turn-helix domain-containing protein [Streptomyces cyaneofuscatus]
MHWASAVTAFFDAEVRMASLFAADTDAARSLVARALGTLAQDTQPGDRLRRTLHEFLDAQGSYVAAAGRLHLRRNTVRYRVQRAVELRGRPIDKDRLELEIALGACRRLGRAVLASPRR